MVLHLDPLKCGYCGSQFSRDLVTNNKHVIPSHEFPLGTKLVCPGTGQPGRIVPDPTPLGCQGHRTELKIGKGGRITGKVIPLREDNGKVAGREVETYTGRKNEQKGKAGVPHRMSTPREFNKRME